MPPKHQPAMYRQDDRLASFQPVMKPKARARHGWPLSPSTYPLLTPENMAHAGFYFAPGGSDASYDTCVCFLCGVRLGGWAEDDDPWNEHVSRGGCAWAETVCQVEVDKRARTAATYADPEDLPSSSTSSYVRENTFYSKDREVSWWPHAEEPDFIPTPSTLAEGGFIFCPTVKERDLVKCPLCEYEVEGWEADDNPIAIHRRRKPDCPFFTAELSGPRKRGKGKKQTADSEMEAVAPTPTPATSQPQPQPKRGHTRTNSRSQAAAAAAASTSGPGTRTRQQTSEAPSEPPKPARTTRTRPKRGKKAADDDEEDAVDPIQEDENEVIVVDGDEDEDEDEGEDIAEVETKPARKTKAASQSKSSRTGQKAAPKVAEEQIEESTGMDDLQGQDVPDSVENVTRSAELAETVEQIAKPAKKGSKSKSSRKTIKAVDPSTAQAPIGAIEHEEVQPDIDVKDITAVATEGSDTETERTTKTKTKTTSESKTKSSARSKSTKTKAPTTELETDPEVDRPVSAEMHETPETQAEVEPESQATTKSKPGRKPRATKAKKKSEVDQDPEDDAMVSAPPPAPAPTANARPASPSRKPLPPLPDPSPARPLSQLERFTNVPPSSPFSAPAPTGAGAGSGRPTKGIPFKKAFSQPNPNREAQATALDTGARAARAVVDKSLDVALPAAPTPAPVPMPIMDDKARTGAGAAASVDKLDLDMTLEQWIRAEMAREKMDIERKGREMIRAFEQRTNEARRRIEAIPTRSR